jgi:hypothetical protein
MAAAAESRLVDLRHTHRQVQKERAVVQREYDALLGALAESAAPAFDDVGSDDERQPNAGATRLDDECLRPIDPRVLDSPRDSRDRTEVVHKVHELEFWRSEVRRRVCSTEALERGLIAEVEKLSAAVAAKGRSGALPLRQTQSVDDLAEEACSSAAQCAALEAQCAAERKAIDAERAESRAAIALLEQRLVDAYNATDEEERARLVRIVGEGERQLERLTTAADGLAAQVRVFISFVCSFFISFVLLIFVLCCSQRRSSFARGAGSWTPPHRRRRRSSARARVEEEGVGARGVAR